MTRRLTAPPGTSRQPVAALPFAVFDHHLLVTAGGERLQTKLSGTNLGFAPALRRWLGRRGS